MKPIPIAVAVAVFACALLIPGCGPADPPEINKGIADNYQTFCDKGASDRPGAAAALQAAKKADPANGYSDYLESWLKVQDKDFAGALEAIKTGNGAKKVVIYVTAPPPTDSMPTLGRVRQVGFSTEKFASFPDIAPEYFSEVRKMGYRVAQAEPVCSLSVLNGAGVVRKAYQSEIEFWKSKKDQAKVEATQKQLDAFAAWYDTFQTDLASKVADLVEEAAKAAGMSESEKMDYAQGKPIKDSHKVEVADKKREALYAEEINSLRKSLKTMPKPE